MIVKLNLLSECVNDIKRLGELAFKECETGTWDVNWDDLISRENNGLLFCYTLHLENNTVVGHFIVAIHKEMFTTSISAACISVYVMPEYRRHSAMFIRRVSDAIIKTGEVDNLTISVKHSDYSRLLFDCGFEKQEEIWRLNRG